MVSSLDPPASAPSSTHHELSTPLPGTRHAYIALSLTISPSSLLLFLTTTSPTTPAPPPMGSLVYAIPSTTQPQPLSTPLYVKQDSVDTATRVAKILANKTKRPCFVGCSMRFEEAGRGGDVSEVMTAVRRVVEIVVEKVAGADREGCGKAEGGGDGKETGAEAGEEEEVKCGDGEQQEGLAERLDALKVGDEEGG